MYGMISYRYSKNVLRITRVQYDKTVVYCNMIKYTTVIYIY